MQKKEIGIVIGVALITGVFGGLIGANIPFEKSNEALIEDFYRTELAVQVSPHSLRKKLTKGESSVVLVDLRSQEEYETAHIITAVNVPAYKNPNESAYSDVERIVNSFTELRAENPDKDIVVYCYSTPCMTGRTIGKMLAEHDIYVKHLGIGWNDWKYDWDMWNHDGETKVNPFDYIASGAEPGTLKEGEHPEACPISGEFGC